MNAFADSDMMVLLPYTPRADADARGYDTWLRGVDNPFFNGVAGIAHYSNWKVERVLWGSAEFTHFDYMRLDPARADAVWSNPDVIAFAADWTRTWGREPDGPELSANYHSYRLHRVYGRAGPIGNRTVLGIGAGPAARGKGNEVWELIEAMVGLAPAEKFVVGDEAVEIGPAWARTAVAGTLIAAP